MKTSDTMKERDIAQATGLSAREVRKRMDRWNIRHDGTDQRNYPRVSAMRLITQHRQQNKAAVKKLHTVVPSMDFVALPMKPPSRCVIGDPQVVVSPRQRTDKNVTVNFRVGPTNSGKTFNALERLFDAYAADPTGTYVYAGPLRMLAFEVYEKMVERVGADNVGFLTGDAQVNPDAPLIACTVEMTPREGDVIILDEAHWCIQNTRGDKWTHLMTQGKFDNFEIICSAESVQIIRPLFDGVADVNVHSYARRTPMVFGGEICINDIPENSAVVCFSRTKVFQIADHLRENGYKVGVLYGALPLATRKDQVARFLSGEYNVMVVTDVIGHGVNLPIDNVVFAETVKYDGSGRRKLMTWEGGQIAGRAGRYGYSDQGTVYLATGLPIFSRDMELVERFVEVAAGAAQSDLPIIKPTVSPLYGDLGLEDHLAECVPDALVRWQEKAAGGFLANDFTPVVPVDMQRCLENLPYGHGTGDTRRQIDDPMNLWSLLSLPLRPEGRVLSSIHHLLATGDPVEIRRVADEDILLALGTVGLKEIENGVLTACELEMIRLAFPTECAFLEDYGLRKVIDRLSAKMSKELRKALK